MKTIPVALAFLIAALLVNIAYAENICQYASSATATSESADSKPAYAIGAPDAPSGGECNSWSGAGYAWTPSNWNVVSNLTLRYNAAVEVNNFTVFGDYDMCINRVWLMNSSGGETKLVSEETNNNCVPVYNSSGFSADTIIIETCGWSWTSTDAVQMCGAIAAVPEPPVNLSVCGNGMLEQPPAYPNSTEECDFGAENGLENSTCSTNCTIIIIEPPVNLSVCGNGLLEQPPAFPNSTEDCDLGALNGQSNSTCSSNCTIIIIEPPVNVSACGDGIIQTPEECDLGAENGLSNSTCSANCTIIIIEPPVNQSICGNGVLEQPPAYPNSTEECDLGAENGLGNSACSANCIIVSPSPPNQSICGNSVLEQPPAFPNSTEECDLGAKNGLSNSTCSSNCKIIVPKTLCQYAKSASATSEADYAKAIYAIGAPDAPYGGDCSIWSGTGYSWSPSNWDVKSNLTLKYNTTVDVNNITVFGDYDMCINNVWLMNGSTGEKRLSFNGINNNCVNTYGLAGDFSADIVILETCGWSWSSTDAVQLCGTVPTGPVCGNARIDAGEECDDGNNVNGDGCRDDCKIETMAGIGCHYAMNAVATDEQPGYEAIYARGTPDSDGNCSTTPSLMTSWKKTIWNSPSNITLTFPATYPENLTVFGDYELCINRAWFLNGNEWYLAQAGSIDQNLNGNCKINYTFSPVNFKTGMIKLETCGWRVSAIDAAKICGSSEAYPKISVIGPAQDTTLDNSRTNVMLEISTNLPSICEFHYEKNYDIGDGINLSTTDGILHSYYLNKPAKGSVNVYYKCISSEGKTNPYSVMHRINFGKIESPFIEVCNWNNCSEGAASISIDDGYHPTTGNIAATCLETLDKNNFKGTYFLAYTDKYNQSDWNMWKNVSGKGHEIGGHSLSHICDAEVPLDKNFYINDTQKNIDNILDNLGMPKNYLTTYAWPCGDYFPEYSSWMSPYYMFARGYHINQIESKNPENFMNYKSVNSLGFGDNPPDYSDIADVAENYQDWVNYVYHDTCNHPEDIDYLTTQNMWVDTIGTVSKYIKERKTANMQNINNTLTGVKFNLYTNLNQTIFNKNLTMRLYLGNGNVTSIKVNNAKAGFTEYSVNGLPYVKFNVPPRRTNTIEISGLKMNVSYCGDRKVNQKSEECDDGNKINGDGCTSLCKNEIKAYVIPYIGDIDGSVNSAWFSFYDKLWKWHDTNNVSIALSFYPRTMDNAQFNTVLANMYLCNDCELVTKGEGINGTDLDAMTYEEAKALIGADQEIFRNKTQAALNAKKINAAVTVPRTYNQQYGRFTKTIRSALHDLGFTMYLEQYITDEYGYTNSMPDFDITQYAVDFTYSGLSGPVEAFKQKNETIQEILDFEDDHIMHLNGIKVVPLMAHQQDFMVSDTNMTLNATKWNIYTATLSALKKDKRFRLLKPQDVYELRHP